MRKPPLKRSVHVLLWCSADAHLKTVGDAQSHGEVGILGKSKDVH